MARTPERWLNTFRRAHTASFLHRGSSVLDTYVVSELVLHGILLLPSGRRHTTLEAAAEAMFREDFRERILPFGTAAAQAYAQIAAQRCRSERPISQFDAQIAAITRSSRAQVATRNVSDYECGIKVLNPWDA
jgi:toxin FitB